jgi:hypothetical protein
MWEVRSVVSARDGRDARKRTYSLIGFGVLAIAGGIRLAMFDDIPGWVRIVDLVAIALTPVGVAIGLMGIWDSSRRPPGGD